MTHPDQRLSLVPPKNQLVLEGRRSQSSEDVPKFTNVTFTLPDKSWGCEYHVSRLQCTRPDLTISDSQGLFEDVSGTSVCNQTKGSILANRFQPDFCYVLKNPLHVGETLDFELHATSVFRGEKGDSVDIQAAPEPGIPVGMQFLEQQVQVPKGSNTRAITWTPRPGQQDKRHVASFLAYIVPADFGGASCSALSRYVHIEVKVPEYESKWVAPTLDKGLQQILTQPWQCEKSGLACNGSSRRDRSAQCTGNENDCVVALKEAVSGAAGPDLVFEVPPGQMIEGLNLQCRSSVKSPLEPLIELINVTRTSAFGSVTEQGHCTSKSCKHGAHLAGWHGFVGIDSIDVVTEQHGGVGVDYQRVQFDFKYASESNTDEGYDKRWCFACRDDAHMYPPAVQCVRVITRLCEAYIQEGDDLHSITRKFHLDRNWRRLWNLNSELTDPHRVVHGDKTLRLGPIYSVREGDSMMTLAARFETTIKRLLSVNPHIVDGRHIMPGLEICVVACSNRPPPSHYINPAYSVLRALSNFSQTR